MDLRLAICQAESTDDVSRNREKIEQIMESYQADVYLFPELFLTRYGNQNYSDEAVNDAVAHIRNLCMKKDCAVAVGAPVFNGKLYNSLLFITGSSIHRYDKLYLANFAPYNEGIFTKGAGPVMIEWKDWKIGLEVCYDVMFPEIHRNYAVNGADIVLVSSASAMGSRIPMMTVLPSRSFENTVYTAYCNNSGEGPAGTYFGGSVLFSPLGEIIGQTGAGEDTLVFNLKKETITQARCARHHIADLRKDILWL